jgi:hypothetical protein
MHIADEPYSVADWILNRDTPSTRCWLCGREALLIWWTSTSHLVASKYIADHHPSTYHMTSLSSTSHSRKIAIRSRLILQPCDIIHHTYGAYSGQCHPTHYLIVSDSISLCAVLEVFVEPTWSDLSSIGHLSTFKYPLFYNMWASAPIRWARCSSQKH